ncbi:ISNCY family transposase [Methylomonas sp. SURF-2]|uniref:ISNCY family transposase n=1 Tax=Methylomonas subterranea TaxID=2952225 RepID=A0ABT1TIR7_9GAMM|nr:ISNCY family transposase [Methylomonas sp. SURF-2]MCQ8105371.1 ISNCY family transposase [Methylomonas sp. SURF-2]
MRTVIQPQLKFGETDIAAIVLDPKSRDDIPQLLRGLQYIYTEIELRQRVFAILEEMMPDRADGKGKASRQTGRPGMEQWKILVLGVLRLSLNVDYDRIQELANQHKTIRQMLGHSDWLDEQVYELQTIRDNVSLLTPEILDRINQEVVNAGHSLLKKSAEEPLKARADSAVVKTDVHFPTDTNLLWDAIRKAIQTCATLCDALDLTEWRQSAYHLRCFKKSYRLIQKLKHSTSQDEAKRQAKQAQIEAAYQTYLDQAETYAQRAHPTRQRLNQAHGIPAAMLVKLDEYLKHAERQIDQIRRRVLQGETIPHGEKVFSIFQTHTEWISKGKAGVPVELGLRVAIVEDQHRFILHHQVMKKTTDDKIAVSLVEQTQTRFPALKAMSFDKGFHSPANQTDLKQWLDTVVLPKKGRLSEVDKARESAPEFVRLRRQHSAVESAINALGVHGLDKCPDHGIDGFKRYVALAIVARNIQRLGAVLREQEQQAADRRRGPYKKAA